MASVFKRGADKHRRGSTWYCNYYDAVQQRWRTCKGHPDRDASLLLAQRLERESARRAEGLTSAVDERAARPIAEHIEAFVAKVRAGQRHERYVQQVEARLKLVVARTGAARIVDLDPAAILRTLSEHRRASKNNPRGKPLSVIAKNEYLGTLKSFTKWAVESRYVPHDPLAALKKLDRRAALPVHPRRSLTPDEVARLLDAAERRPLVELRTVRTGANVGQPVANVRRAARRRAEQLGLERRIAYLIAVWTGLRRGEIGALTWGDLDLDGAVAVIRLRAETTKSRRADRVVMHPQLAEALREYRSSGAKQADHIVPTVPSMKALTADLKLAGIDPGTRATGFVDFHALRMTCSTLMAVAGMTSRTRQAQMRHSDPKLTENVYMDATLLPVAAELQKVPAIPSPTAAAPASIPIAAASVKRHRATA